MSKKPKTRRASKTPSETRALRTGPNWPLLAVASLGMVLTAYLSFTAFTGGAVQGCSAGGGCSTVLTSQWATLLGLPTSLWGLLGYAALAAIAFVRRAAKHWSYAWTVAFFGVCYSVYLTVVSLTILGSACPYCLTSLALMTATLALVTWQRPPEMAHRSWVWLAAPRGALAAVVILALHANYVAPQPEPLGPEDPAIRGLAEHLADEGVLFYGASWCPHCQEQKRLFGASASRLPYIECSPAGQNAPQSPSCNSAGIESYPTWIIKGRAYVGQVLSLSQLASATAFPGAANFK
ncbi:MAG: vitamin K epoxide reductase family protein [Acidobacteria bacterium]|nr:vitamin K epoxide reductase family protein [Acidobacteriota bacterium]